MAPEFIDDDVEANVFRLETEPWEVACRFCLEAHQWRQRYVSALTGSAVLMAVLAGSVIGTLAACWR